MALPTALLHLLDPAAYAHPAASVRLIETHISWVLIAGEYAYKIKKPLDLGFLDFSTLAKRRFCCDEEIRLNRRLAPDIYLDVVAVTDAGFTGAGETREWAVRMRAFPADATLDREAEVTTEQIDAIAERVARFHGEIAVASSDYGSAEAVMHPVRENLRQIFAFISPPSDKATKQPTKQAKNACQVSAYPQPLPPQGGGATLPSPLGGEGLGERGVTDQARLGHLETWSEQEHLRLLDHFDARKASAFIRECHGDLHLGNIAWVDHAPLIFDCIEFNPGLRFIDVISEVAFLCMDLIARGLEPLAWRFLNRYLEHTGDYAGLAGLRFYLVYRALVRAKVAGIRASQGDAGSRAEMQRYLDLAERLTQTGRPALLLMHGFSGSGKSRLSQRLLQDLGAVRLRSDVERKRLFNLHALADSRAAGDIYTAEAGQRTFARLRELAGALLDLGFPVIVDATFLKLDHRAEFIALAETKALPWRIVSLQVDADTLRRRVARRQARADDASEADLAVLESQIGHAEPLAAGELAHLTVHSGDDDATSSELGRFIAQAG